MKRILPSFLLPVALFAAEPLPPFEMSIERLDPALDALIAPDTKVEKLAEGFNWSEGPTWFQGSVVFSDVPENIVYQWKAGATKADIFLKPSGMTTPTPGFREQGSNGLNVDAKGNLLICQHGDRRISRYVNGKFETIADKYDGKRFNSPNDLALRRNGDIYFTDPPYGLEKLNDSPLKEMPWNGVYRVTSKGEVTLIVKDLTFPNGIGFSPDEKTLYVAVSDENHKVWMRYDVAADGTVSNGKVLADATANKEDGLPDGLKVDSLGNVWATGPGGVWVFAPDGKHLGTIKPPEAPANCGWGDDGKSLYMTARTGLYRIKLAVAGMKPLYQ